MCGIFGYIGLAPESQEQFVYHSSRLLRHRGPDDHGFESGSGWGVGFRRLSILDLSDLGHQPMSTPDGRFWIVFNGEIYNYVELREDLERRGEKFRSTSDTEVLLRLLSLQGPQALGQLNGMFALAFVDTKDHTYLLARDRLGQKPLYYYTEKNQLRFASELKALLAWPNAPRDVNLLAVAQYLAHEYLPNSTCIFDGYYKLPPAHYIQGSLDRPEYFDLRPYWQLEINGDDGEVELSDYKIDELHNILSDATRIRMRSDVPVGIFLSGGIDSGLIAAMAAEVPGGGLLKALTVSFSEEGYDETILAQATAEHINMKQELIRQQPSGLADVDRLTWFFDEPFGDPSAIPTFTLCKIAAENGTVFLAGDGGDEAFGGYRKYIRNWKYRVTHSFPPSFGLVIETVSKFLPLLSSLRYRVARKSLPDGGYPSAFGRAPIDPVFLSLIPKRMQLYIRSVGQPYWDSWKQISGPSIVARWQKVDYALYLPDDILVKIDRASMAHSIELRSPFLDYRIVEWAASLPRGALLNTKEGKLPLRTLANTLLPDDVRIGEKKGFGTPLDAWFKRSEGQSMARHRLLSARARDRDLWNHATVEALITAQQSDKGRDFGSWLWRLLVLDAWARQYLDSNDFIQGPPL